MDGVRSKSNWPETITMIVAGFISSWLLLSIAVGLFFWIAGIEC